MSLFKHKVKIPTHSTLSFEEALEHHTIGILDMTGCLWTFYRFFIKAQNDNPNRHNETPQIHQEILYRAVSSNDILAYQSLFEMFNGARTVRLAFPQWYQWNESYRDILKITLDEAGHSCHSYRVFNSLGHLDVPNEFTYEVLDFVMENLPEYEQILDRYRSRARQMKHLHPFMRRCLDELYERYGVDIEFFKEVAPEMFVPPK